MTTHLSLVYLRPAPVRAVLFRDHLCQEGFASELGLSRQHWSTLYNRRRSLTAKVRRALLANARLAGIAETELFEVVPIPIAA